MLLDACNPTVLSKNGLCRNWGYRYPTNDDNTVSGYVLHADPASLCMAK